MGSVLNELNLGVPKFAQAIGAKTGSLFIELHDQPS